MLIIGTAGNDELKGTSADETFYPLIGKDRVEGGLGNDRLVVNYSSLPVGPGGVSSYLVREIDGFQGILRGPNYALDNFDYVSFREIEAIKFATTGLGASVSIISTRAQLLPGDLDLDAGPNGGSLSISVSQDVTFNVDPAGFVSTNLGTFSGFKNFDLNVYGAHSEIKTGAGNDSVSTLGGYVDVIDLGLGNDRYQTNLISLTSAVEVTIGDGLTSFSQGSTIRNAESISATLTGGNDHVILDADRAGQINASIGYDKLSFGFEITARDVRIDSLHDLGMSFGSSDLYGFDDISFRMSKTDDTVIVNLNARAYIGDKKLVIDAGAGYDWLRFAMDDETGLIDAPDVTFRMDDRGSVDIYGFKFHQFDKFWVSLGSGDDLVYSTIGDDVFRGGLGSDTIVYAESASGVQINLDSSARQNGGTLGKDYIYDFENIIGSPFNDGLRGNAVANALDGGDGNDNLFGFAGDDTLLGGLGNDNLQGGEGNDVLKGGVGRDWLVGGAGADQFVLDSLGAAPAPDTFRDFAHGEDSIVIDRAAFTAFASDAPGTLAAGSFVVGTKALTLDQHLIYNPANGYLFYDADGSGAGARIHIATLAGDAILTASDFLLA